MRGEWEEREREAKSGGGMVITNKELWVEGRKWNWDKKGKRWEKEEELRRGAEREGRSETVRRQGGESGESGDSAGRAERVEGAKRE